MPKFTWEGIRNQPQEMKKLIGMIERIDQTISTEFDPRLKNLANQLRSLQMNPEQENAKQLFESGMEMLGDRLGYVKHAPLDAFPATQSRRVDERIKQLNKPEEEIEDKDLEGLPTLYDDLQKIEGYQEFEDQLDLVEAKSAGYVAEHFRSYVYDVETGSLESFSAPQIYADLAVLHDKVKNAKDWKKVEVDPEDIKLGAEKLVSELQESGGLAFMDDLTNEQMTQLAVGAKNGAEISNLLYRSVIKGAPKHLVNRQKSAVPPKGDIFPAPYVKGKTNKTREEWDKKEQDRSSQKAAQLMADIIVCREVSKLKPEAGKTYGDVGKVSKKARDTVMRYAPSIVAAMPRKDLSQIILMDTDGTALEGTIRRYVATLDKIPEDLPDYLHPSAKDRIEVLQHRIKKEKDAAKQRQLAAEIIANRELAGAKRGGEGLENRPDPAAVAARTAVLTAEMSRLRERDPKAVSKVVAQATSGHGGKMAELYHTAVQPTREAAKKVTYLDYINQLNLEEPTNADVARLIAATSLYINQKDARVEADLKKIDQITEETLKDPAFRELMKDPNTIQHAKMGLGIPILEQMGAKREKLGADNQKQNNMEEPQNNKIEKNGAGIGGPGRD